MLHRVGLTPRRLDPQEYRNLLQYGIGLTDLIKSASGNDNSLGKGLFDPASLRLRLKKAAPKAVAFNGKRAASEFLGRLVEYGLQPDRFGKAVVFVLPSTSGAARGYWNEQNWVEFAEYIRTV